MSRLREGCLDCVKEVDLISLCYPDIYISVEIYLSALVVFTLIDFLFHPREQFECVETWKPLIR